MTDLQIEVSELFSTSIYTCKVDDNFCDALSQKVISDKDSWQKGLKNVDALSSGWDGLDKYEELKNISNWISQSILPQIGQAQNWKYNNWWCKSAWINFYEKGDTAKLHNHKFMDYCGILILKPGNGNLVFVSSDVVMDNVRPFQTIENQKVNEKKGTLILFPDHMFHQVIDCENQRISVAFNFVNDVHSVDESKK
tara:strand:- start:92 stop:679 length:588 start_codon:yes stop_codon:yes gene_type:complete